MPKKPKELSHELKEALKQIVKECEDEDIFIRKSQVKTWKKNEEFWHGVQYLFWNDKEATWISPQSGAAPNLGYSSEEMKEFGPFYDYVIDIFTAHGESIISALSAQLPSVRFVPDNSEDDDDVSTAKTYDKLVDLISRHNNAQIKFLQKLFYYWIDGFAADYRYIDTDFKYGSYRVPVFEPKPILVCPECGAEINAEQESEGPQTDNEKEAGTGEDKSMPQICQNCGEEVVPQESGNTVLLHVRDEEKPKSRVKYEVYNPLFVKVPVYAFDQDSCGYLGFYLDKPKDELIASLAYDDDGKLDEEINKKIESEYMINDERWARLQYQYPTGPEMENKKMATLIQFWLRPSKFNMCLDLGIREELLKTFPKGVKVVLVGKTKAFISAKEENLDERWTVSKCKLSTFVHGDPLCRPLVPIAEMRNQLDNLVMDTIEHGMPETFADSEVLDFDAYGNFEAKPGYVFKAKARPGKTLAEGFHTLQKAQVPREIGVYRAALDKDAQFCVGSFPSLYGGPSEGKSRTLGEYNQSRQQALQRLTITWKLAGDAYRKNMEEMVRMFVGMMVQDEHYTKRIGDNYLTIWIRKSQMTGKIGGVESEVSDSFPMSIQQKQALVERLIELNNPQINAALYSPENRRVLQYIFSINELKMPGANQIYKQVYEINEMIKTGTGPVVPMQVSSVPIDPLVDDDAIHIAACKDFLVDDMGLELKKQKPEIYADIQTHLAMHQKNLQLKTLTQFEGTGPGQQPDTSETSDAGGDE